MSKKEPEQDPKLVTDKTKVNFVQEDPGTNTTKFKYYPDDPESAYHRDQFRTKQPTKYYDPCQESAQLSFKCLELNNYDRSLCKDYFDAYRECKKQWLNARKTDRSKWE
ncbi:hypothetical protein KAFR_0F00730 [Kazachstania africana CBS 2517]|uniref:Cytochrome c oxidase-assembly factor COX23, mitochondrial n=1 Tax=Kazachstania africana (strain ATCC 22294 / BCRC 22015 / CBS 2517 / CECT 1963 / NBRC 1671 / NRRL Y-8276) TaxID=1071382 RepID=H2AWC0_KAZAF|nr:hypothetical protein KAFR_0F00730 [Kazachstania africana CBS 2517]CCF58670.1 hypothetical protein KAFR_0F00730 [Kazachstania africana CBS 2517]